MRAQKGFSLAELLLVVIIVGILAAIAVPNFARAVERAKVRDAQGVLVSIYHAERLYYLDHIAYGNFTQLVTDRYLSNPDAGDSNQNWNFDVDVPVATPPSFTATATRTQPNDGYDTKTIALNRTYTGTPQSDSPTDPPRVYKGNHPLRD